jgi:hypothetical protein
MVWAERLGLPSGWHGRQPDASRREGVRTYTT